jgi:DNA-binding beta-propeller fold protein YncE
VNGVGSAARFAGPYGLATDSAGNLYVTDAFDCTIRKISAEGTVSTIAGSAGI